jgi:drug/metabolite transporter (DMT)-like permease
LYVRAHRWISTPFQLVFWQALLATSILSALALAINGVPQLVWDAPLSGAFLYAGICGTALAHWAMVMVNRSLPAVTTSLGLLATPVMGVATSAIWLGEPIGVSLIAAMVMILAGIAIGTIPDGKAVADRQGPLPGVARPDDCSSEQIRAAALVRDKREIIQSGDSPE